MSATILNPSTMLNELPQELQDLVLDGYVAQFDKTSPEWSDIFRQFVRKYPNNLRVKELFETVEMYRIVEYAVSNLRRKKRISTIYDMACGHALLGIMLAYRFHDLKVVCVDREKRDGFDAYVLCWKLKLEVGSFALMAGNGFEHMDVLQCFKFAEGDSRILMQKMSRDRLKAFQKGFQGPAVEAQLCKDLLEAGKNAGPQDHVKVYGLAEAVMARTLDNFGKVPAKL